MDDIDPLIAKFLSSSYYGADFTPVYLKSLLSNSDINETVKNVVKNYVSNALQFINPSFASLKYDDIDYCKTYGVASVKKCMSVIKNNIYFRHNLIYDFCELSALNDYFLSLKRGNILLLRFSNNALVYSNLLNDDITIDEIKYEQINMEIFKYELSFQVKKLDDAISTSQSDQLNVRKEDIVSLLRYLLKSIPYSVGFDNNFNRYIFHPFIPNEVLFLKCELPSDIYKLKKALSNFQGYSI